MRQNFFALTLLLAGAFALTACSDDDKASDKTYKVGDFYDVNGIQGVVFKVSDGGRHGLIVSLDEMNVSSWASAEAVDVDTKATNEVDGAVNMMAIEKISDWQSKFPAFAWCGAKNEAGVSGWYLPALHELESLYVSYAADKMAFNKTLTVNGGTAIVPVEGDYSYWSSSQNLVISRVDEAAVFAFWDQGLPSFREKDRTARVRAVRVF